MPNLKDGFGLTDAQVKTFLNSDTVITMNIVGQAQLVDFATINYGTRF